MKNGHSQKDQKNGFQDQLLLNAGQKYCRMLPLEHSAILLTSLSYKLSLRPLFCLFLSGRFTQVLLYYTPSFLILLTCNIPVVSIYFQSEVKTLWILDQMACFKSQLIWNLHFFQKRINPGSAGQGLILSIGHR